MAETNECTYASNVKDVQVLDSTLNPYAIGSNGKVTHELNTAKTLNASSTPPVTKAVFNKKALSSGAATLDLTALVGTNGATVNMTGLKVQVAKFRNPSTNANPITVADGASNGYNILGDGSGQVTLKPGMEITIYGADQLDDVAAGDATIDLTGTGAQELEYAIVAG